MQIAVTFRNQQVLKDCSWEVKKGERVGLVGKINARVLFCRRLIVWISYFVISNLLSSFFIFTSLGNPCLERILLMDFAIYA